MSTLEAIVMYILGMGFLVCFILAIAFYTGRYEEGQIDAMNGNIKYELQERANGERKWTKIQSK